MATTTFEDAEVQDILQRALRLPPQVRKDIAVELFESATPQEDSEVVKEAWRAELARRVADIESGKVRMIPHAEALAYLRQHLSESLPR
jgi:putative addiction module component (TIGR02574 family)